MHNNLCTTQPQGITEVPSCEVLARHEPITIKILMLLGLSHYLG